MRPKGGDPCEIDVSTPTETGQEYGGEEKRGEGDQRTCVMLVCEAVLVHVPSEPCDGGNVADLQRASHDCALEISGSIQ